MASDHEDPGSSKKAPCGRLRVVLRLRELMTFALDQSKFVTLTMVEQLTIARSRPVVLGCESWRNYDRMVKAISSSPTGWWSLGYPIVRSGVDDGERGKHCVRERGCLCNDVAP